MLVEGITEVVNATLSASAGDLSSETPHKWLESTNVLQLGANLTALLGFVAILRQMIPVDEYVDRLSVVVAPYVETLNPFAYFDIPESNGELPNDLFEAVRTHLSSTTARSSHKASLVRSKGASKISYTMSAGSHWTQETFQGHPVWWNLFHEKPPTVGSDNKLQPSRSFTLKIHKRHRDKILDAYMEHVVRNAKRVQQGLRERLLYTNSADSWYNIWTSIPFNHPSTFQTLALDPDLKKIILDDLTAFSEGEEFYKRVGRAWKRGYLLYGPPGTGKSSMIAALANFLNYDIYDLELTHVKSNLQLRKLLLHTTSKSIIVIEDIDCTLDLSNRAKKRKASKKKVEPGVTLSGLLNFTDGIWSCCGSERLIVFTTNHIDKLDPALLRSGRMDMKIELSYCGFPAFKVLAANYLGLQDHELFPKVQQAMVGSHMTPADLTEYLIHHSDADTALQNLVSGLEANKLQPLPAPAATSSSATSSSSDDSEDEATSSSDTSDYSDTDED